MQDHFKRMALTVSPHCRSIRQEAVRQEPNAHCRATRQRVRECQVDPGPILIFSLMMNGRNNGKKIMAVRIVQHAFEIIHLVTEQNPVQVLGE